MLVDIILHNILMLRNRHGIVENSDCLGFSAKAGCAINAHSGRTDLANDHNAILWQEHLWATILHVQQLIISYEKFTIFYLANIFICSKFKTVDQLYYGTSARMHESANCRSDEKNEHVLIGNSSNAICRSYEYTQIQ